MHPHHTTTAPHRPILFSEFFELGLDETASPFLTPSSRRWGRNLDLRSSILAAILLIISFWLHFIPSLLPFSYIALIGVYFLAGIPSLIESIEDLSNLEINIDVLMTLAAFSSIFIGSGLEGGLLLVLFAIAGSMEEAVRTKAKGAIRQLHKLSPQTIFVLQPDGSVMEKSVREVDVGAIILVKVGLVVPLDGEVIEGISAVNLVHLTGENLPVTKRPGDEVPSGAQNLEGPLVLRVIRTSSDSTVARIIQLVTQAQESRPQLQRWFDSLSKRYATTIIACAVFFALSLPYILNIPFLSVEGSVYRALAFLIAASPCALIIAIPIAYLSAVSACARKGVLMKGGIALDALANCKVMAFDKTGTLTTGELKCSSFLRLGEIPADGAQQKALGIAYALEQNALHPLAKAVIVLARESKVSPAVIQDFLIVPGFGLEAKTSVQGKMQPVYIGHPEYVLLKLPTRIAEILRENVQAAKERGELVAALTIGNETWLLQFQESLRPNIKIPIQNLKNNHGIEVMMLTGDHEKTAKRIAEQTGIDIYHANLKPEDKLRYVSKLSEEKGLAMVGDGINDAPSLARATVGICMGKVGATIAMEAADIILLHDNLEVVDWLINKAHQTQRVVKQNLILASCAIVLASLPALAGWVPLWLAVVLHEGGTVLVSLNGLRLLK